MNKKMTRLSLKSLLATGTALLALGAVAPTASAADAPDFTFDLPVGEGCPTFDLRIEIYGPATRVVREFYDKQGNLVRVFAGGKGNLVTLTNLNTGSAMTYQTGGSVEQYSQFNSDGSFTYTTAGHNIVTLFPTDYPAGPSTKLYLGRVVYNVDSNFTFTMLSSAGRELDICAALD